MTRPCHSGCSSRKTSNARKPRTMFFAGSVRSTRTTSYSAGARDQRSSLMDTRRRPSSSNSSGSTRDRVVCDESVGPMHDRRLPDVDLCRDVSAAAQEVPRPPARVQPTTSFASRPSSTALADRVGRPARSAPATGCGRTARATPPGCVFARVPARDRGGSRGRRPRIRFVAPIQRQPPPRTPRSPRHSRLPSCRNAASRSGSSARPHM